MVHQLIYSSIAVMTLNDAELEILMGKSRSNNEATSITGILLHIITEDPGTAAFVQVLEGDEPAVRSLYATIEKDELHRESEVLFDGPAAERMFSGWTMRLEVMSLAKVRDAFAQDGVDESPMSLTTLIRDRVAMRSLVSLHAG